MKWMPPAVTSQVQEFLASKGMCKTLSKPQGKRLRSWIKPFPHNTEWHFTGVLLCDVQFQSLDLLPLREMPQEQAKTLSVHLRVNWAFK